MKLITPLIIRSIKSKLFSCVILCLAFITPSSTIYSQTIESTNISISKTQASPLEIIKDIESKTSYNFVYDESVSQLSQRITINEDSISISAILNILSEETNLKFHQINNNISVRIDPISDLSSSSGSKEITGKITDNIGNSIIGANIIVKDRAIGTTSDFQGQFTLQIPDDTTTLVISYIGYKTQEVNVENRTNISIVLQEDASQLDEVVITGFRKSLEQSLDIKKDKINSVDVVVAEDIAKFPQSNMAEALQRVSGVQIRRDNAGGVGESVSIRGLPSEYTQVTINGDAVPNSTSGRSYDFNTLPAEIFKQLEVSKTPTASSTEGGIGGSVNLVTKKPFELKNRVIVASAEGNFNTQQQQGSSITPKLSLTYGNKWNDKFGIIAGVFYNKFFNNSEGYDVTRYYDESYDLDRDGTNEFQDIQVPRPRYVSEGQEVERLSANLSLQFQANKDFDIVFNGLFVNNDQVKTRYTPIWFLPGSNPSNIIADGPFVKSITYETALSKLENQRQQNVTKNYRWSIKGKYNLHNGWKAGAKYIHAFNKRDAERFRYYADNVNTVTYNIENDIEFFDLQTPTNFSNSDEFVMSQARRYLWDYSDEIFTSKLDLSKKFSDSFNIKFGVSYRDRTKTQQYFFRRDNISNEPFRPVASLLTGFLDNVDRAKGFNEFLVHDWDKAYEIYGSKLDLEGFEVINAAYDINEGITAGYIQGDYSSEKFEANAGLRVVRTGITSKGYQLDETTQIFQVREVKSHYIDYLPSINLKWKLSRELIVRGGVARVITRPSLQRLSPFRLVDEVNQRISSENPELDPFRANQYDFSIEWYPVPETLISGGLFLKDIESFISRQTTLIPFNGSLYELRQPVNGNNAVIKGFEVNFQQPFTFLPGFLSGFGIVTNYTFAESDFEEELEDGSSTTYALPNNSKNSLNITPYYEKYGFSLRVATNYRSEFLREIPNIEDGLKYRDNISITDIASSYDFNENFGITLNILNAFNAKRYEWIMEERFMDNVSFFGTTFQFGARMKF
ncbi:TonB-dependent receptor [Flavobacteriaceae bacterium]|nr:TonB-dependent receptor [Flavobacteriaceae bacterium]